MGAQISTNLSSGCFSREQRYLNIKSKADLGRYIKDANKSTLMVINFTTTWSHPCIDAEPPMRKLAEEFPDVKFARVDIDLLQNDHTNAPLKAVSGDDSQDVVKEFVLKTMPTILLCKKVDDGLDKGKGTAEVGEGNGGGGGHGGGNRISSANNVKEGNSVVPSANEDKRTTSIKRGNSVVPSATEGKSADSVKEGNRAAAGAAGGKSGTGVTGVKEPSPKRRVVNYAGKKVYIDEIDRMEGPLEGHELSKKIEYCKNLPTTASFKLADEFYRYLEKSKPTQLMVINFTTEWCEPCKKADEPFKKLSKVYKDVKFAKVDVNVDVLMNIAKELDVTMTPTQPTFLLVKVKKLEKEHVKKDGVQGDQKDKEEPTEKEYVKKDGVQGEQKGKKEPPVLNERYKMVKLAEVVGWDDNKEGELREMIGKHRYTTT
ncbi:thioredoxin H4-like protein [Cinnamomum micranthum f. kanehirae]|uniref:Thioredoxin H4-like protein n=1 Tax=Cinnamomum micranthum f. kanehirae TaxID=337451 RepID=A0A3S3MZ26_9MAGN|nr:thioredoxin H4-like protein [Cinnamomum micranthum f. kanehirae]